MARSTQPEARAASGTTIEELATSYRDGEVVTSYSIQAAVRAAVDDAGEGWEETDLGRMLGMDGGLLGPPPMTSYWRAEYEGILRSQWARVALDRTGNEYFQAVFHYLGTTCRYPTTIVLPGVSTATLRVIDSARKLTRSDPTLMRAARTAMAKSVDRPDLAEPSLTHFHAHSINETQVVDRLIATTAARSNRLSDARSTDSEAAMLRHLSATNHAISNFIGRAGESLAHAAFDEDAFQRTPIYWFQDNGQWRRFEGDGIFVFRGQGGDEVELLEVKTEGASPRAVQLKGYDLARRGQLWLEVSPGETTPFQGLRQTISVREHSHELVRLPVCSVVLLQVRLPLLDFSHPWFTDNGEQLGELEYIRSTDGQRGGGWLIPRNILVHSSAERGALGCLVALSDADPNLFPTALVRQFHHAYERAEAEFEMALKRFVGSMETAWDLRAFKRNFTAFPGQALVLDLSVYPEFVESVPEGKQLLDTIRKTAVSELYGLSETKFWQHGWPDLGEPRVDERVLLYRSGAAIKAARPERAGARTDSQLDKVRAAIRAIYRVNHEISVEGGPDKVNAALHELMQESIDIVEAYEAPLMDHLVTPDAPIDERLGSKKPADPRRNVLFGEVQHLPRMTLHIPLINNFVRGRPGLRVDAVPTAVRTQELAYRAFVLGTACCVVLDEVVHESFVNDDGPVHSYDRVVSNVTQTLERCRAVLRTLDGQFATTEAPTSRATKTTESNRRSTSKAGIDGP